MKCGDKRRSTLDSEGNNGLKENKRPKSLDEYIKEKRRERGVFFKPKFLQNANKSSKSNSKAPNLHAEVVINIGLIEANEKGIVSIKRGSRLAIKIAKKFSSIEVARVAVANMQTTTNFFVVLMIMYCAIQTKVLCNLFLEQI